MPKGLPSNPSDAIAAYHVGLEVDSTEIAQFSEISGLTIERDVITLKENIAKGGHMVIKQLPGARKPPTITLKRAKNTSMDLYKWWEAMDLGKLADGRRNGSVVLYDYEMGEVGRYNFVNAWVSKITMSAAKAGSNEPLMEEVSIVCEDVTRVK